MPLDIYAVNLSEFGLNSRAAGKQGTGRAERKATVE